MSLKLVHVFADELTRLAGKRDLLRERQRIAKLLQRFVSRLFVIFVLRLPTLFFLARRQL